MEWIERLNSAVEYMEAHLLEKIDYEKVANIPSGYEYAKIPDIEVYIKADPKDAIYEYWLPVVKKVTLRQNPLLRIHTFFEMFLTIT